MVITLIHNDAYSAIFVNIDRVVGAMTAVVEEVYSSTFKFRLLENTRILSP